MVFIQYIKQILKIVQEIKSSIFFQNDLDNVENLTQLSMIIKKQLNVSLRNKIHDLITSSDMQLLIMEKIFPKRQDRIDNMIYSPIDTIILINIYKILSDICILYQKLEEKSKK